MFSWSIRSVRPPGAWVFVLTAFAGVACGVGCSREELDELVEKSKQQVEQSMEKAQQAVNETSKTVVDQASQTTQAAQQQLGAAGQMTLALDAPLQVQGCYARYVPPLGGRPGVLQLRSYHQPEAEKFPSVYLRVTTNAENAAALRDQTLAGQLFLQKEAGGAVWQSDAASPVQIKISQSDDKTLVAELTGGSIRSFPDGGSSAVTGKFEAVWQ